MEGGDRDSADGHDLSEVAGVIPRAIHQIFTTLDGNDSEYTVKCRCGFDSACYFSCLSVNAHVMKINDPAAADEGFNSSLSEAFFRMNELKL